MNRRTSLKSYVQALVSCRTVVWSPTRNQLLRLCPHLTITQAEETLMMGDLIATPPFRADGGCFVAWYKPAYLTDQVPVVMIWAPADEEWGYLISSAIFKATAEAFAAQKWPQEAPVQDGW